MDGYAADGLTRRGFVGAIAAGGMALAGSYLSPAKAWAADADAADARELAGIAPYASPLAVPESEWRSAPKRVFVVVDYQVDFVEGGVLGKQEPALSIQDALYDRVREYQERGDIVIYTMDTHPSDTYADTREAQVNPPHCVPGTKGWNVFGRLAELLTPDKAICLMKGTFGSTDLPFVLKAIQSQGIRIEYIELAGLGTTCRMTHNAVLLYNFFPELPIVVDARTTASFSDELRDARLDEMEGWGFIVRR